ncbi:unnamed protein product [Bemisia tabaci]|uniref:Transmembrane protein 19 n=1 Tax=Bemisia tabaci TaxID=7038 RepID=A0A9P0AAL7_BEMTA|nr:unnamed protein product [Bemisia tabaci]
MAQILPIVLTLIAVPLSMLMWAGNLAFSFISYRGDNNEVIPPVRWLVATLVPLIIAAWGLKRKSLNKSGAFLGLFVGFILTLSSWAFLGCLLTFFVTSSRATKFRSKQKEKMEEDFKEGGQRNWVQVLCNSGMAVQLALFYILDSGCGERPINFSQDYRASWLSLGILGAIACSNGDTWASELGPVLGSSQPFLITSGKSVPKGTNGGVSWPGLLASAAGGAIVGLVHYLCLIYILDSVTIERSPPQWPLILAGVFGGFVGSLVDSLLGATLQYSGLNKKTHVIVERPGKDVVHISGSRLLDNHSVNLLSSIIMGLLTPRIANLFWP